MAKRRAVETQTTMEGDGFPPPIPPPVKKQVAKYRLAMEEASAASKAKKEHKEKLKDLMREHGIERVSLEDGTSRDFVLVEQQDVKLKRHATDPASDRSAENAVD